MPLLTCGACNKSFAKKEHYNRHLRTHTRERPFLCHDCGSSFARADTLKRHATARHNTDAAVQGGNNALQLLQDAVVTNAMAPTPSTQRSIEHSTSQDIAIDPMLDLDLPSTTIGWQWEDNFQLDPDFDIEGLGTYDIGLANADMPWIPLRQQSVVQPHLTGANQPKEPSIPWFTRRLSADTTRVSDDQRREQPSSFSRSALATSLQHKISDPVLPPTSFLNRAIHTYTTKLWPLVPIVHLPTFVPAQSHPLLLLSICSLGALAEGSAESFDRAVQLYEGVQKAILVAWNPSRLLNPSSLSLVQAATIGQMFAILSNRPGDLATARAFHGTLCVAMESFLDAHPDIQKTGVARQTGERGRLEEEWHKWIRLQTCIRVLSALQCHDGELASTFQRHSILRLPPHRTASAAPDSVFLSATAKAWRRALSSYEANNMSASSSIQQSPFTSSAYLSSILAQTMDLRVMHTATVLQTGLNELENLLIKWNIERGVIAPSDGSLSLPHLFHSCFIQLLCNYDMLERWLGRGDSEDMHDCEQYINTWVCTDAAKRCVIHALSIAELTTQTRIGDLAALHVARSIFQAAAVLLVYATMGPQQSEITAEVAQKFPELASSTGIISSVMSPLQTGSFSILERCKMLPVWLSGALRSLRPWPNAARYANTLDAICARFET